MPATQEIFDAYGSAWNTLDSELRRRLIALAMTEDAEMAYPPLAARGWDGIAATIGAFQQRFPGASFVQTSEIEEHHGWFRAAWRFLAADGSTLREGVDIAETAGDGRIRRVIGFFDPLPPLRQSRDWSARPAWR